MLSAAALAASPRRRSTMKTQSMMCALLVSMAWGVATGQQVSVNYNHSQSFAQYHTYAWGSNNANQVKNSILAQVAVQDIDTAMQGKGFSKVQESQNPDLILTSNGGMRQETSYSCLLYTSPSPRDGLL